MDAVACFDRCVRIQPCFSAAKASASVSDTPRGTVSVTPPSIREPGTTRDLRRNRLRIGRESSYELWSYESTGDPLFDHAPIWSEGIDLRFLFVDRMGTGEYQLDYSNSGQVE